jgi:hypothetical protein
MLAIAKAMTALFALLSSQTKLMIEFSAVFFLNIKAQKSHLAG